MDTETGPKQRTSLRQGCEREGGKEPWPRDGVRPDAHLTPTQGWGGAREQEACETGVHTQKGLARPPGAEASGSDRGGRPGKG